MSVLTALLFGLAPAIAAARGDLGDALKAGGRGSSESRDHRYLQSALVVSEVALACLLLVGTGLLLRSFWHVLDINLGFETSRTYALRVDSARETDTPAKFHAYMSRLIPRRGMCRASRPRRSPMLFRSTATGAGAFAQKGSRPKRTSARCSKSSARV